MNLTLKQLFKFGAVCVGASALSATAATNYVADSFEVSDGGSYGLAISQYKFSTETVGVDEVTNYAWFAEANDASAIVSNDAAYASFSGDGPIAGGTAELVLNLETEGNTLSRTAGVVVASDEYVYVDTMIQFTPSDTAPTIDTADVKVALYVDANSNLVVRHTMYTEFVNYDPVETNSVVDGVIDPDAWYRLSIAVTRDGNETFCRIALDGTVIQHANAFDLEDGAANNGTYFRSCEADDFTLEKVSFEGTGLVDELVITDTEPDGIFTPSSVEITLFATGGNVTFDPAGPVASGATVAITATDDWKWIASLTGPVDEAGVVASKTITTTLTAVASCTVTAVVDYAALDQTIGGNDYPYSSVAAWAQMNNLAEGADMSAFEDQYLLNIATNTTATISITGAVNNGSAITLTVGSSNPSAVDFQALNGSLKLYHRADLTSGDWAEVGTYTVDEVGTVTVDIDFTGVNPTDFFKAVVE